uniref:Uncharacterized protein n=1 Tax=Oryza sativa subsp. japonica TaxID=39947 RepID=Q8H467_ORYSJ|nr:hypothetical protein [Oryza sativa Japonica Group]
MMTMRRMTWASQRSAASTPKQGPHAEEVANVIIKGSAMPALVFHLKGPPAVVAM